MLGYTRCEIAAVDGKRIFHVSDELTTQNAVLIRAYCDRWQRRNTIVK